MKSYFIIGLILLLGSHAVAQDQKTVDTDSMRIVWTFKTNDWLGGTPVASEGILYISGLDDYFRAIDINTGEEVWHFKMNDANTPDPVIEDDRIIFAGGKGVIYCLNKLDGTLIWKLDTKGGILANPASGDGLVFFGNFLNREIYAISIETGTIQWMHKAGGIVESDFVFHNHVLYFGDGSRFKAIVGKTGELKWDFATKTSIVAGALIHDQTLYFGNMENAIYALDLATGTLKWTYDKPNLGTMLTPALFEGYIICSSSDGTLNAIDALNGKKVWSKKLAKDFQTSVRFYQSNIYIGGTNGCLYKVAALTGELLEKQCVNGQIFTTVLILENRLFFGSTSHYLYCLSI